MLVYNYTTIHVNKYNIKNITDLYGDILEVKLDEDLDIPVNLLPEGSGHKVKIICDFCGTHYENEWRKYLKIFKNNQKQCCSSKKCKEDKKKETNLKKWGVDNPMKSEKVRETLKKSILKNWGVDHYSKTDEFKEKIKNTAQKNWEVDHYSKTDEYKEKFKKTSLNNWGVDHPMKSKKVREVLKKSNLEKWGVDNPSKLDFVKSKVINTNLEKWGVDYYSQSDEFKEKSRETCIKRYGVDNPLKVDFIKEKVRKTCMKRYGVDNYTKTEEYKIKSKNTSFKNWGNESISKSEEFRKIHKNIAKDKNYISYLDNKTSLFNCDKGLNHQFEISSNNYINRNMYNTPLYTVCNPIGDSVSIKEKEVFEFIDSIYSGKIEQSYRDGLEIDIYLPELKLGFEFNGLYWHSEKYKDKWYHINKSEYFKDKGIRVIHIWEDDWDFKKDIIKSQIRNWLGLTDNKIFARKCKVKEIKDSKIATKFLNDNHVQGKVNSSLKLGLYHYGELVSIMTFDHFEGRNRMTNSEWNINRFCNKLNTTVIGGASKLFKHFIKEYSVSRVISYADRDWSSGDLYDKLEFIRVSDGYPDYKYIVNNKRVHKSRFKKSITGITESKLDILKIWDCGKIKFEKVI